MKAVGQITGDGNSDVGDADASGGPSTSSS